MTRARSTVASSAQSSFRTRRETRSRRHHSSGRGRAIDDWFASLEDKTPHFAIADIPLLFETGRHREFDVVIVTECAPSTQITRVMARDDIGEAEARARVAAQLPIEEKVRRADHVINTDGAFEETNRQVRRVFDALVGG